MRIGDQNPQKPNGLQIDHQQNTSSVLGYFFKSYIVKEHIDSYALTRKHIVWGHHFPKKSVVNHLISSDICFRMIQQSHAKVPKVKLVR